MQGYYAYRRGQWKLILGDPAGGKGDGWYCTGLPCPFIGWSNASSGPVLNASSVQLYDVIADPAERENRAMMEPELVSELITALKAINATAVPAYACGEAGDWIQGGALTPFVP